MSKDTYYFTHDYNARTDKKIKRLILKHGLLGYGIFWAIIEDLYNNANALPTDYESIAFDLHTQPDLVKSIVNDFELFVIDGANFGSSSVKKRLEERNSKSVKAKESALKRWSKDANALPTQSEGNAIKESKGKEKKLKEIKKEFLPSVFLTESEYSKIIKDEFPLCHNDALAYLSNYKMSTGKKYKSDYHALIGWVKEKYQKEGRLPKPVVSKPKEMVQ